MALILKDSDGAELGTLMLGGPKPRAELIERVLNFCAYAEASGLELDECCAILGRKVRGTRHVFSIEATEEVILNWR